MGFEREYAAILSVLWDIGQVIDNYVTSPSEETYSALMESGISSPHKIEASSEESSLDWDGTGLDPIFKIPFNPDEVGVNVHYLTSMFN